MSDSTNKTAFIVGGTSGIGRATVLALLEQGNSVHIVGRSTDKVADTDGLTKHRVDITDANQLNILIDAISSLGKLDYLVNASGIFGPKPFLDHTREDDDSYLDLNQGAASSCPRRLRRK